MVALAAFLAIGVAAVERVASLAAIERGEVLALVLILPEVRRSHGCTSSHANMAAAVAFSTARVASRSAASSARPASLAAQ